MKLGVLFSGPARAWSARRDFGSTRDLLSASTISVFRYVPVPSILRGKTLRVAPAGYQWPCHLRIGSQDMNVFHEIHRRSEYEALYAIEPKPKLIVDLGSNIGITCGLWKHHWPDATILAVEPAEDNLKVLRQNADGLPGPAVQVFPVCVGGSRRQAKLATTDGEWAYSIVGDGKEGGQGDGQGNGAGGRQGMDVEVITMDDLLAAIPADQPIDLMKCDIEGAEEELFATCGSWIGRVRYLAVELHGEYTPERLKRDLQKHGVEATPLPGCEWGQRKVEYLKLRRI